MNHNFFFFISLCVICDILLWWSSSENHFIPGVKYLLLEWKPGAEKILFLSCCTLVCGKLLQEKHIQLFEQTLEIIYIYNNLSTWNRQGVWFDQMCHREDGTNPNMHWKKKASGQSACSIKGHITTCKM